MKRLLFIAHRIPYPPDKGDRVRAFHEIRALADHFDVTLATLAHQPSDMEAAQVLRRWCRQVLVARGGGVGGKLRAGLALLTNRSATEGYFSSPALRRAILQEARQEPFAVALAYCSSTLPYALKTPAHARVMDLVDVDSAKWDGYANQSAGLRRWFYRHEASRVRRLEHRSVAECDAVLLVSQNEADALGIRSDRVLPIPNGVDTEYFSPAGHDQADPAEIVFTGSMDYRPNIDGVCWFAREVLPSIRKQGHDAHFWIVGRDPARAVLKLAEDDPGVHVTGTVDDVRPYLARAQVAVAPLQIARGIQNKVLEAMAMGKCVVASHQAAEGIEAVHNVELLVVSTAQEWADRIVMLLRSPARRAELGLLARLCVKDRYGWPARMAPLVKLCQTLSEGRP